MFLLIDTTERDNIFFILFGGGKHNEKKVEAKNRNILIVFNEFLKELSLSKDDVQGIAVIVAEGSFTSTRLAVTVANTFAYAEKIPVLAVLRENTTNLAWLESEIKKQPIGQYISAEYSGEPNIGR